MTQMDLFEQEAPAAAEVIPFPIDRHLVFIRHTARQLERRQGPAAEKFWKTECRRLYGRLQVQGMADAEIRAEIDRFANADHTEMQRAAWAEWQHSQGGAA